MTFFFLFPLELNSVTSERQECRVKRRLLKISFPYTVLKYKLNEDILLHLEGKGWVRFLREKR
jgi:hypothetical protein